jgi:hypothetical protein
LITEPVAIKAYRPPSALLDRMPLLKAEDAERVVGWLHALGLGIDQPAKDGRLIELAQYYFGDTAGEASSRRFAAAIDRAYELY